MSRIEKQRHISIARRIFKLADFRTHGRIVEVGSANDRKAHFLQGCRHVAGVIGRVWQFVGIDISAIADDEGYLACGQG